MCEVGEGWQGGPRQAAGGVPHPVELGPGHGHAVVVLEVAATAVEELLRQEHEVLLGQAPVALHFGLEFHVERLAQLRPQDFVRHCKRHPALVGREARTLGENSCMIYSLNLQKKNTDGWMELHTLVSESEDKLKLPWGMRFCEIRKVPFYHLHT